MNVCVWGWVITGKMTIINGYTTEQNLYHFPQYPSLQNFKVPSKCTFISLIAHSKDLVAELSRSAFSFYNDSIKL